MSPVSFLKNHGLDLPCSLAKWESQGEYKLKAYICIYTYLYMGDIGVTIHLAHFREDSSFEASHGWSFSFIFHENLLVGHTDTSNEGNQWATFGLGELLFPSTRSIYTWYCDTFSAPSYQSISRFFIFMYIYIYIDAHLEPKYHSFWLEKALFWGVDL